MSFANAVPTKHSLSQLQSGQGPLMPKNEPRANPGGLEDFINELNQATNLRLRIQDDVAQDGRVKIKKNPETKEVKPNPELQILQQDMDDRVPMPETLVELEAIAPSQVDPAANSNSSPALQNIRRV